MNEENKNIGQNNSEAEVSAEPTPTTVMPKETTQTQNENVVPEVSQEPVQNPVKEIPEEPTEVKASNGEGNTSAEQGSSGPIVGIAIIVIVLIVGGIYFWSTAVDKNGETGELPTIQSGGETDAIVNQLESQSTSDEVTDIEADLNTTDLEKIDSELNDILNEL